MFLLRGFAVWLVMMGAEVVHGTLRTMLLVSLVGDLRGRRAGVFVGSLLVLGIACLLVRWIGAGTASRLLALGLSWLVLTASCEFSFGRFVLGLTRDRLMEDYDLARGGLMPVGLLAMALAPLLAARLRPEDIR